MRFARYMEARKNNKAKVNAERKTAARVLDRVRKGGNGGGFPWKEFLRGSMNKKQRILKEWKKNAAVTKAEMEKLKTESEQEFQHGKWRKAKIAKYHEKIAELQARITKFESKILLLENANDAGDEKLISNSKAMKKLEEILASTEEEIRTAEQAGPNRPYFFFSEGMTIDEIRDQTGLRDPTDIDRMSDASSYEVLFYFQAAGVELNTACEGVFEEAESNILSKLARKDPGPPLAQRQEFIAKVLGIDWSPDGATEKAEGNLPGVVVGAAAARKRGRESSSSDSDADSVGDSDDSSSEGGPPLAKRYKTDKD